MGQWISVQAPLQFQPGQRMPYFVTHSMTSEGLAYTDQKEESVTVDPNSFKLDTAELNKSPEDVFDIISKVGEGSYGSVHKAIHRGTGHTLAIKKVPVDTDLQEIIKEITIMQQCDSRYVVKYYGSYFKNSDLWIVMEYCGAGSVSDIMRLRRKTLNEAEIGAIMKDTLLGLNYLHGLKKIHRDIKAGNILLNMDGNAKLADFGVAGQLTDTMAKRNTVIGTPFWMAPELIQEIGYDTKADIWSCGITAIEMAEGRPPHAEIHPMRAIFMIPTKPPPTLKNMEEWSQIFSDFIGKCLVKNPEERTTADELLQHEFITTAKGPKVIREMIGNAQDIAAQYLLRDANYIEIAAECNTLIHKDPATMNNFDNTFVNNDTGLTLDDGTLIQHSDKGTNRGSHRPGSSYEHITNNASDSTLRTASNGPMPSIPPPPTYENAQQQQLQMQQLASGFRALKMNEKSLGNASSQFEPGPIGSVDTFNSTWTYNDSINSAFHRAMNEDSDYSFLRDLSTEELLRRKESLEKEMDAELRALQARYHAKRQAILDAIALKKNGTVQF